MEGTEASAAQDPGHFPEGIFKMSNSTSAEGTGTDGRGAATEQSKNMRRVTPAPSPPVTSTSSNSNNNKASDSKSPLQSLLDLVGEDDDAGGEGAFDDVFDVTGAFDDHDEEEEKEVHQQEVAENDEKEEEDGEDDQEEDSASESESESESDSDAEDQGSEANDTTNDDDDLTDAYFSNVKKDIATTTTLSSTPLQQNETPTEITSTNLASALDICSPLDIKSTPMVSTPPKPTNNHPSSMASTPMSVWTAPPQAPAQSPVDLVTDNPLIPPPKYHANLPPPPPPKPKPTTTSTSTSTTTSTTNTKPKKKRPWWATKTPQEEEGDLAFTDEVGFEPYELPTRNLAAELLRRRRAAAADKTGSTKLSLRGKRRKDASDKNNTTGKNNKKGVEIPYGEERVKALALLKNPIDQALQCLLWDAVGVRYTLLEHQFEAVRAVAGTPTTFPLHECSEEEQELWQDDEDESNWTQQAMASCNLRLVVKTKGMLLADVMGLGKTVQGVCAVMLRNALYEAQQEPPLPTVVVGPNDAVLQQWEETLLYAGESKECIHWFKPQDWKHGPFKKKVFVLIRNHQLLAETRRVMNSIGESRYKENVSQSWPLFPNASVGLVRKLKNQYESSSAKRVRNIYKNKGESDADCVTRLLTQAAQDVDFQLFTIRTLLIDEAHFLKNLVAYWGIGAALLGAHAERVVPLTGTPYNNGPQDMASIMTFIDPTNNASRRSWWENATTGKRREDIVDAVRSWRMDYMLRRGKNVLTKQLPKKKVTQVAVAAYPLELGIYQVYEGSFLTVLGEFLQLQRNETFEGRSQAKQKFSVLMAAMSCMRMALIHPMLPGGREATIKFSPSRRHLLRKEEKSDECVCCQIFPSETASAKHKSSKSPDNNNGGNNNNTSLVGLEGKVRTEINLDDEDLDDEDTMQKRKKRAKDADEEKGPIVPMEVDLCSAAGTNCEHFVHAGCMTFLRERDLMCPRCEDIKRRAHVEMKPKDENGDDEVSERSIPHGVYCKHIQVSPDTEGFTSTAKIECVLKWFNTSVKKDEKAIILSFFKGGLDLLEGIFMEELKIDCARFDGDVPASTRAAELDRFKTTRGCRVLLATVQSGGTGLNIVEANNVCFLDRWFNPCVHAQAEDRCHRIKQKREVKVVYNDVSMTVDQVMAAVNTMKSKNASVLLADGTELGAEVGSISYSDLSGVIGQMMRQIRSQREIITRESPSKPLPASDYESLLETGSKKKPRKIPIKPEYGSPMVPYSAQNWPAWSQETATWASNAASGVPSWAPNAFNQQYLAQIQNNLNLAAFSMSGKSPLSGPGSTAQEPLEVASSDDEADSNNETGVKNGVTASWAGAEVPYYFPPGNVNQFQTLDTNGRGATAEEPVELISSDDENDDSTPDESTPDLEVISSQNSSKSFSTEDAPNHEKLPAPEIPVVNNAHNQVMNDAHNQVVSDAHNHVVNDVHNQVMKDAHNQAVNDAHHQVMNDAHDQVMNDVHNQVVNRGLNHEQGQHRGDATAPGSLDGETIVAGSALANGVDSGGDSALTNGTDVHVQKANNETKATLSENVNMGAGYCFS